MDLLKTAFNMASTAAQNYYATYTKQQKLREQLNSCSYPDDVKFMVEKAVKQVYNVYPNFTSDVLEFFEKGEKKRYLQLKCIMDIEIKGKICKVDYNMMLPPNFPKKPPYVRIINQSSEFRVDPFYQNLRSPTDPNSYILNEKLTQTKKWDQTKSIVNIVIESQNMMRQNFPFLKQSGQFNNNVNPGWMNVNQNQYNNNQYNQYNQYGNSNNYGNQNTNSNSNAYKRPPIPFSTANVNQSIANGQKFAGETKKIIEKLKKQHIKSVQKIQYLEAIKSNLESEQQYLRHQNIKITNFIQKSERSSIKDLSSLIRCRDERSQQILDLSSSIRARDQCMGLLESRFNEGMLSFDQFMKLARRIEQQKFEDKFLLFKCIQSVK